MLRISTLNIRNTTDRYKERRPILANEISRINSDIIGFQEVCWDQIPMLYEAFRKNAMILQSPCRDPILSKRDPSYRVDGDLLLINNQPDMGKISVLKTDILILSYERVVQKAILSLKTAKTKYTILVANTHLHDGYSREDVLERERQCENMIEWIENNPEYKNIDAYIVMGDFNCVSDDPTYKCMLYNKYKSSHLTLYNKEPYKTFPSGLIAETMDKDNNTGCIDYIWIKGKVKPLFSGIWANYSSEHDRTLYPSDHFGVFVDLEL